MVEIYHKSIYQTLAIKNMPSKRHNYACTVKQKFASNSKTVTSLGTKAHQKIQKKKTLCFNYCVTMPPIFKVSM